MEEFLPALLYNSDHLFEENFYRTGTKNKQKNKEDCKPTYQRRLGKLSLTGNKSFYNDCMYMYCMLHNGKEGSPV